MNAAAPMSGGMICPSVEAVLFRLNAMGDVIDQAVELHGFDLDSKEITHVLDRVRKAAENCNHHLPSFLNALSLERGIDHQNLIGDRVSRMSLHAIYPSHQFQGRLAWTFVAGAIFFFRDG